VRPQVREARGFSPRSVPVGDRTTLTGAETWLVPAGSDRLGAAQRSESGSSEDIHVHALRDLVITL
jgi:hypothetical protein